MSKKSSTFAVAKVLRMKKSIFFAALCVSMTLAAQKPNEAYLAYIEQWKETAIQQQIDYGVPAAITMAQALLESGAGKSELAVNAKNHFGIKCTSDWFGGVYYHDDDRKSDCFRQYYDAAESFKDHSLFLKRARYASCFEIAPQDYEAWAYRLRDCGYATDYLYAPKLVKIIETYHLDALTLAAMQPGAEKKTQKTTSKGLATTQDNTVTPTHKPASHKRPLKATVVRKSDPIMVINSDPEPPYVEPLTAKQERDSFFLAHTKHKQNGVSYVVAHEGDTYANVAFRLNVRERDLREDNDALGRELQKGDRIYLSAKKKVGDKDFVWTHVGLSLWELSQNEGVTIESIQKLNGLDSAVRVFRTRQKIYLKKVKEESKAAVGLGIGE